MKTRSPAPDRKSLVRDNMRPGVVSRDGFLGTDSRELKAILRDDASRVRRLKLTHARIARRMNELKAAGMPGLGDFMRVPPHYEIRVDGVRGRLPCPFGEPVLIRKTNILVRNLKLKEELSFTDLNIHLIRQHGFYEGRGSPFRIDPESIARVLDIPLLPSTRKRSSASKRNLRHR